MRRLRGILLAMLWALFALPAALAAADVDSAANAGLRSSCHASATHAESLSSTIADKSRWHCGGDEPSISAERALLSFSPAKGAPARFFGTRPSLFGTLSLAVVSDGKIIAQHDYTPDQLHAGPSGRLLLVPLPAVAGDGDRVVAAFTRPSSRGLFGDARIFSVDPTVGHDAMIAILLSAAVCGMLLMPLAFNAAYYRVLRERFVLWHILVSAGLLIQCLLTSGIVGHLFVVPISVYSRITVLSFGLCIAAATAFGAAFIEPGKLDPRLRQALYWAGLFVLAISVLQSFFPGALGSAQTAVYYGCYVPVMALFIWVMIDAWKRGSRSVRFQVVGWAPFLATGVIRIVSMLNPDMPQTEAVPLYFVAMVVQSIATSLGVADRFLVIKQQRDRALSRASSLERLSERDDLTGLYNRRALDGPLGDFTVQEFTGFAVFDLDNFKRVNDTHGHAVGDMVLRTVASVLGNHDDAVAVRMGGEEYLLLLRGADVQQRVERLREAIPVRIAREVAELEMLVTASAGLVEVAPGQTIGNDFVSLYRAADDLLYEAKHNGRNLLAAAVLRREPGGAIDAAA